LIKPGDPRLKSEFITYDSPKAEEKSKDFIATWEPKETAWNNHGTRKQRTESI
jgi:hypothetical protein